MTTTDPQANPHAPQSCTAAPLLRIAARDSTLGDGMRILRALPARQRRTIGAWCFLDHFGPLDVRAGNGLRIGPHPHTGLQTFTWPIAGEIFHRDSLGSEQLIRPGQVNLMTAGRGIVHSEESPADRGPLLHGAQLWIALPAAQRGIAPSFEHYPEIPSLDRGGARITVMAGRYEAIESPVRLHSALLGLEVLARPGAALELPLRRDFEHGLLVLEGGLELLGEAAQPGELLYLPPGAEGARLRSPGGARALLLGGTPYPDPLVMWWNFIAGDKAELARHVSDWNAGRRFGEVRGYPGPRLPSPVPPWAQ